MNPDATFVLYFNLILQIFILLYLFLHLETLKIIFYTVLSHYLLIFVNVFFLLVFYFLLYFYYPLSPKVQRIHQISRIIHQFIIIANLSFYRVLMYLSPYGEFNITNHDVACLKPGEFLNDKIINFYLARLMEVCTIGLFLFSFQNSLHTSYVVIGFFLPKKKKKRIWDPHSQAAVIYSTQPSLLFAM